MDEANLEKMNASTLDHTVDQSTIDDVLPTPEPSGLSALPKELRVMIFEEVLNYGTITLELISGEENSFTVAESASVQCSEYMSLLRVDRQFYADARPIFYDLNVFKTNSFDELVHWLEWLPEPVLKQVRNVRADCTTVFDAVCDRLYSDSALSMLHVAEETGCALVRLCELLVNVKHLRRATFDFVPPEMSCSYVITECLRSIRLQAPLPETCGFRELIPITYVASKKNVGELWLERMKPDEDVRRCWRMRFRVSRGLHVYL